MIRLIASRLLWAIPLLFVVSVLTFALVALTPGDPASTILGPYATQEQLSALRTELGFDQPWYLQYWSWLTSAVQGDLGTSLLSRQPVVAHLNARLPVTLSITVLATVISTIVGVALGVISATRGPKVSRSVDVLAMFGFAIPNFWLGVVLVSIFAVTLGLLPATGYVKFEDSPTGWIQALILPVVTISVGGITTIAKQTRDAMRDVMARDFIDALRADGWSENRIIYRYALRNASIPVVTAVGVFFVGMLSGTVLVETVFAMPGLGGLAVTSTAGHDLPVILGVTIYFCIGVVIVNLLIDLLYGWLNPKARTA